MIIPTHNATAENQAADHYGLLHNARGTRQREASSIDQSPKKGAISHIFTGGKVWEGFKVGIPLENLKKPLLDFCRYTILYLNLLNLSILLRQTGRTRPKILWSGERWYHWSHGKHRWEVLYNYIYIRKQPQVGTTVDGSEIRRSPVEVDSLSHYL